jgi:asparagine synthase (glutamine-hydrolysing)
MCGILGYLSGSQFIDRQEFVGNLELINHRGPDDWGVEEHKTNKYVFFQGFRRLSIIDLSNAGHQPMTYENLTITFNGEVYNYKEIKEDLTKAGYDFESQTDTEVILKSIHYWGINKAVSRFVGMFAIAVYNNKSKELLLVRDRMGIKPVYYYHKEGTFIYSSEVKPLINFKAVDKQINKGNLIKFLSVGYVPAPDTIFEYIKVLQPGKILKFASGEINIDSYWSLERVFNSRIISDKPEKEIKHHLKSLIETSVKYRMVSDVPVGAFLSGGVDSSLTTAVMQSLSETAVNTFTIGFKEKKYNEAGFAKEISQYLGTNHYELYLSVDEAKKMIPELIEKLDMPFGDSSAIPMMLVSKLASQNVTVVLSGDGGDELFCGYNLYDQALRLQKFKSFSKFAKPFRNILFDSGFLKKYYKYLILFYSDNNTNIINSGNIATQLFANRLIKGEKFKTGFLFSVEDFNSTNIQELNMLANINSYLHDDILKKVDFATMAYSIESRVPLLDHRIVEYSFEIPHNLKYHNGTKKHILKEVLYDYVPKKLLERPKKGFSVPVFQWLHNDLFAIVADSSNPDFIDKQNIFDKNAVKELISYFEKSPDNYFVNNVMWNFVVFQQWYKNNLI